LAQFLALLQEIKAMKRLVFAVGVLVTVMISACNKNSSSDQGTSKFSVYLTDDPSTYKAVNIDIKEIRVKYSDDTSSATGWTTLQMTKTGVYNLLKFSNGMDTLLTGSELPSGTIKQIRLVLGTNNTLVAGNTTYTLETPSSQQSGLKLNINAELLPGIEYKLWLDFDAGKSIVQTGNGKYILKPVIRAYAQATSGAIKGVIMPLKNSGWLYAIRNTTDTIASALADTTTGNFMFGGLAAGTYKVSIKGANNYKDTTLSNVAVTVGTVTNVGTIQLKQ
jgi:hypothetical protein